MGTSDYGSMEWSTSWGSQELNWQSFQSQLQPEMKRQKTSSYNDLLNGKCTIKDVMTEFRLNGSDAPFEPEDQLWTPPANVPVYGRQRSWPGAERGSRPQSLHIEVPFPAQPPQPPQPAAALTEEQRRVLSSLPDSAVLALLRELQQRKRQPDECRFCKNNGERESFYRGHALKDGAGRVACPVLRAFVCRRCGARGDTAHTIKYCPLSTNEERLKSAAMMRSVRKASGRRRSVHAPSVGGAENYVYFWETPASFIEDNTSYSAAHESAPLDPRWAALEQKLML